MTSPKKAADEQEVVWQAEGVLMEMFDLGATEAGNALRWHAHFDGRSVFETAVAVLSRVARGD